MLLSQMAVAETKCKKIMCFAKKLFIERRSNYIFVFIIVVKLYLDVNKDSSI